MPVGWRSDPILGDVDEAIGGPDGYVKITALAGARSLAEACEGEAGHRMQPYGPRPKVDIVIKVADQSACRITPTVADAQGQRIPAGLIVMYPVPLEIEPRAVHSRPYPWLVVWTDPAHLGLVERSLRFVR